MFARIRKRSLTVKKLVLTVCAVLLIALPAFGDCDGSAKAMVAKGVAHIADVGPEQAASDFMTPGGAFIEGDKYLLFYKYDGTCLALGARPEIAGKNRWDVHDPDGVYQIREMVKSAKAGGGWVKYKYANPKTGKVQFKKTWVQPVPGMDAFVGCGVYY